MTPSRLLDLDAGLRRLGYERFRPGQREAIECLLAQSRLLLVAPTGGGKSLIYQLPASLLPGTSLVVSPLVSLMQDQVRALEERGLPATFLASTLAAGEMRSRLQGIARGAFTLVYAAPERLVFPGFRELVRRLDCPLVAIDEAHCISEWGHDFRPEYLEIGPFLAELRPAHVLACTATATPVVRDEILARLGLDAATPQLVRGFARPNLALRALEVPTGRARERAVDALLAEALGEPGAPAGAAIVYAPTRRAAEEECGRLTAAGWRAGVYHAGLEGEVRTRVQQAFASGGLDVVVATNAFGMGIDRADVRAVVHLAPPGSIEAYYQEVGRAGRDGKDAWGLLLVSPGDMPLRRHLIERGADGAPPSAAIVEHKWSLFLELMRWAEGGSCRHDAILRYFGDESETLDGCGRCDVCTAMSAAVGNEDPEAVALVVRKALSAVARVDGRFGIQAAARLLRGDSDPRLARSGLDRTPTFGVLAGPSLEWLLRLLRRCVTAGWVDFRGEERPVAVLTREGRAVMKGERPARVLLPREEPTRRTTPPAAASPVGLPAAARDASAAGMPAAVAGGRGGADLDEGAARLFEQLRAYRLRAAREESVPPYVIASDRTLRDIAVLRPRTIDELLLAHGIGETKARRYGRAILEVVAGASGPEEARS